MKVPREKLKKIDPDISSPKNLIYIVRVGKTFLLDLSISSPR